MLYEKEGRYIIPFDDVPSPRAVMPEISVEERRGNFTEVETGFSEEVALREAKRCLSCRRCLGCALCWAECQPEAIDFSIPDETLSLEFEEVILTPGQDYAFAPLDPEMGYGRYADVITDLQFERMLSPTGPTKGLVVSPLDGEIPERLAIVQGNGEAGESRLLSSLVLGVNEAILALHRTEGLGVTLVSPMACSFRDRFLADAEAVPGLRILEGTPLSVTRREGGTPLTLTYSSDARNEEGDFDLIVVLTKPEISKEIQALGKKLGQLIQ